MNISKLAVIAILACAGSSWAQHKHGDNAGAAQTLEGEILDMSCYLAHEGQGPKHAKCAKQCALGGVPLGLLTADKKVYLLVSEHGKETAFGDVKALAGEKAKITGKFASRGGISALLVHQVEKAK
ncbi:MAG: hypothetical protein HY549_08180 [Elusimicrobia bacterium]|nr:hypothetical protein [Elusimicrobiota bacterium]